MGLIEDIVPGKKHALRQLSNDAMIEELWKRGVTVKQIFGKYYEWEEMANGHWLTVEDAELAVSTEETKDF